MISQTSERQDVVLIEPAGGRSPTAIKLGDLLGHAGVSLHVVENARQAVERVTSAESGPNAPAVVLLAPDLPAPVSAARQLHAASSLLHIVFLANAEQISQRRRELALAPMIGTHWSVSEPDDPVLTRLVSEAIESSRQRRQLRTTLDRMNVRLSSRPPVDSREYRKLVTSDRYLANVLKHAHDAIFSLDPSGTVVSWNRGAERLFEVPAADAAGRRLKDIAAWPEEFNTLLERALQGEAILNRDLHLVVGDRAIDAEFTLTPLREEGERLIGAAAIVRDVTEHKRQQAALRESEARFRAAFEQAAVGIAHVGLDGRWMRVNDKLCDILGYPREELLRLRFQDITHPDDLGHDLDNLRRLVGREIQTYSIEKRYVRNGGGTVWANLTVSLVSGKEGHDGYFVSVVEDITARKEAERRLREESEVVETISRVGRAIAAELDTQKLIQTITDATTELTGAKFGAFFHNTKDESGKAMWLYTLSGVPREAFEKFPLPRATHLFGPTLRGEGVVRVDDVLTDARYGRNAPYNGMPPGHLPVRSYLAVSVVSRSGEVLGGLFFGHPQAAVFTERAERIVTGVAAQAAVALDNARLFEEARKADAAKDALLASEQAARAEAERASRTKDEFLATLSHELRTPLNAILGWATLLRNGRSGEEDLAQGLDTIERNARAQTQIIEDLLDMSRIISGKVRLDVQRVVLEPILRAAVDTVTPAADAKGVRVRAVLDPLAGPISGDPARLQQVFWNLLTNAIKFTPRGGRVQVVLERVNSHLEVSVTDTGEGIRPEFLPHVFDRFRQADATTTRRHGGLGLGLSIVKQLVELHGGTVRAKSMGEGHGSTFVVSLPLAVIHPESEADADRRHPRAGGDAPALVADLCAEIAGVKVLVVDDEPDARALVKRLLEDCKAIVTTAASAAEGLEKLQTERPDVLVSDIGMPAEDGYSFIRRVRAMGEDRGGGTPAVALTAYARAEDRMRAIRAGFQMHVPKPVEPAELITMVASLAARG